MDAALANKVETLRRLLTETGEGALPYKDEVKFLLENQLKELFNNMAGLGVKSDDYTYNDGRSVRLLVVHGTVPMYYKDTRYNIPVSIWLTEEYPRNPPIVYVTPTPGMIIKPDHTCVNPSGVVRSQYLGNWNMKLSNLVDLSYDMGILFGQEPPLFSKPPAHNVNHPERPVYHPPRTVFQVSNPMVRPTYAPQMAHTVVNPYASSASQAPQGIPPNQAQWWKPQACNTSEHQIAPAQQTPAPSKADVEQAFRSIAIKGLSKRLTASMDAYGTQIKKEAEEAGEVRNQLYAHGEDIAKSIAALQEERGLLEARVRTMALKSSEIAAWLQQVGGKVAEMDETVDPDFVIVPDGPLGKQLLDTHAEDMALEDVLSALDKALHFGVIELDAYLKQVRKISRRQFFARALELKINEANSRSHQAASNHHPSRYVSPQSSSWGPSGMLMNPLVPGSRQ